MAISRPASGQSSATPTGVGSALVVHGQTRGATGRLVRRCGSGRRFARFTARNRSSRTRRVLVVALDLSLRETQKAAAVARRGTGHGPGDERHFALAVGARGRG